MADGGSGLEVIQVRQDNVDITNNIGQSLSIATTSQPVQSVRLTTTETDGVAWELTADGGANWEVISDTEIWTDLSYPGTDLLWRVTLNLAGSESNPTRSLTCSSNGLPRP